MQVTASGLELYNEELRDLATAGPRTDVGTGWDAGKAPTGGLKLQERPVGKEGRVVPEVGVPFGFPCQGLGRAKTARC